MSDTKKISQYGFNFQVKFITCLITDKLFLEQIYDILDEKYMGNDAFLLEYHIFVLKIIYQ
jgi:hypothetical protein